MATAGSHDGENDNAGFDYQLETMLFWIDQMRKQSGRFDSFDIGCAVNGVNVPSNVQHAFDDVVLHAKLKNGPWITNMIQVKLSKHAINRAYLCTKPKTYVFKYFKSFLMIKPFINLNELEELVIWTNMRIVQNIQDWFEAYTPVDKDRDILGANGTLKYRRFRFKYDKFQDVAHNFLDLAKNLDPPLTASKKDLDEFYERFVFYVEVPKEDNLKTILAKSINHYDEWFELLKTCAFKQMITHQQIESIVTLLSFRHSMKCGPYLKLKFGDMDKLKEEVNNYLSGPRTPECLSIRSAQDVDCTVSRLISVVENYLAPLSKRYLVVNLSSLNNYLSMLQTIINDEQIAKPSLNCLIITIKNSTQEQEVQTKLKTLKIPAILVGNSLQNCLEDEFDVNALSQQCKTEIFDTEISLSEQQTSTARDILQNDIFLKENYPLVLALYQKSMSIESNVLSLDQNFIERTIKIDIDHTYDSIYDDQFSEIVISNQAGMGKSSEMASIAVELRKRYQDHLVIYFECKVAMKHVGSDIKKIICKIMDIKERAQEVLIECLIRQRKMILLLDGIDEICDSHREHLESMLKSISKLGLFKLFIATRPHCDAFLKEIFPNRILCQLSPFSEEDQLKYLIRFWKVDDLDDKYERNRVETNIKELITRFRSMLKDDLLIGIPMQTYMMAVIYRESLVSPEFEAPKPYTIGLIYRKFVDLKFTEVTKRQFDTASGAHKNFIDTLEQSFISYHIEMSAKIYTNSSEPELEQLCKRLQTYGIVRLHPSVGFGHHTYFEYFITLYFLKYKTDANEAFTSFMKQNLCPSRLSIATKFLDHHIDGIDPNTKLQSLIDNTNDSPFSDFEPPSTPRLHPEKLREFNHYLRTLSSPDQYTLLRNALNLSVFNVFEVIYDSLPRDTKSSLRFCFGKKEEEYFVNLKFLGGNQMLQLLAVLLKKNPDNFIHRYLTDFSDEDEDFLEVACRKPFIQVLIWLVDDLIPQIDDQEREALAGYVNRRFDKYLQLVVQHNNTVFLEEAINRAKVLWSSSQTVQKFLLGRNVLSVFLKNVEVPCNTKELLVKERIKMVGVMYDLFHWASSNGNVVLGQDCIDAIANLKIVAIRSAFSDKFQDQ